MSDRRYNAKLILPDGTEKPSLIVYYPPTLTGEEVEDIGREILAVFSGTLCSDVEDEEGRGTTTEDMLDAGLLDSAGVNASPAPKQPPGCDYPNCGCPIVGLAPQCGKNTGRYRPASGVKGLQE
jgi:hypothetical protein